MLLAEDKTGHKQPANPKQYRKGAFNVEIVLSCRRRDFSFVCLAPLFFDNRESKEEDYISCHMTPSCLINLKLREHLCKIEFLALTH